MLVALPSKMYRRVSYFHLNSERGIGRTGVSAVAGAAAGGAASATTAGAVGAGGSITAQLLGSE